MKQERPAGCGSDATTDVVQQALLEEPGNIAVTRPVERKGTALISPRPHAELPT